MKTEYTNFLELYRELNLNPERHALWVVHHEPDVPLEFFADKIEKSSVYVKHFLLYQEFGLEEFLKQYDNVYVWESTVYPNISRHFTYLWWFDEIVKVSNALGLHDNLLNNLEKIPKYKFDALLGRNKNNRQEIYDFLIESNLIKSSIFNMFDDDIMSEWIRGSHYEKLNTEYEYPQVIYEDKSTANASTFLPIDIYNNSWYSIVAETEPTIPFFTEKTAKPLLAKRIFVTFGTQHQLKKLKELGFFTFDRVIDESYDDEPNRGKRWQMAFQQLEKLNEMDPYEVYKLVDDIVTHNQKKMLDFSWDERMRTEVKAIVNLEET